MQGKRSHQEKEDVEAREWRNQRPLLLLTPTTKCILSPFFCNFYSIQKYHKQLNCAFRLKKNHTLSSSSMLKITLGDCDPAPQCVCRPGSIIPTCVLRHVTYKMYINILNIAALWPVLSGCHNTYCCLGLQRSAWTALSCIWSGFDYDKLITQRNLSPSLPASVFSPGSVWCLFRGTSFTGFLPQSLPLVQVITGWSMAS